MDYCSAKGMDNTNFLVVLSRHEDSGIRSGVAGNERTPTSVLDELAVDPAAIVRAEVASNPACSAESLGLLMEDPELDVRIAAGANTEFPPERFQEWMELGGKACENISRNPNVPESIMLALLERQPPADVPSGLMMNPAVTPRVLEKLCESDDEGMRGWAVSHPKTPSSAVRKLLRDEDPQVRAAALTHWSCPVPFLTAAIKKKNFHEWHAVAGNACTPRGVLGWLALYEYTPEEYHDGMDVHHETGFRDVLISLASNPMTPGHVIHKLASSEDPDIAAQAKRNPAMGPADILQPDWSDFPL